MNNKLIKSFFVLSALLVSGCAGLDFGDDRGLAYYDQKPYLFVTTTQDCVTTSTIVSIPAEKREVKFKTGYGSANLSISLNNGMITSAGQTTDTKIPETLNAVASLGTAATGLIKGRARAPSKPQCEAYAALYAIENGKPITQDVKASDGTIISKANFIDSYKIKQNVVNSNDTINQSPNP
jgi:hypothetical protein